MRRKVSRLRRKRGLFARSFAGSLNRKASDGEKKRKAEPVLTAHLQAMAQTLDKAGTLEAKRDKALLLVGFAGALRRSELGSVTADDIAFESGRGIKLTISRKQDGPRGRRSVDRHRPRAQSGDVSGASSAGMVGRCRDRVRSRVPKLSQGWRVDRQRAFREAIRQIIKARVGAILRSDVADDFSGHSLRRGFVSQGVLNGATERGMMKQTRHRSVEVFRDYIKDFGVWTDNESGSLGLNSSR